MIKSDEVDFKLYAALANSNVKFIGLLREYHEKVVNMTGLEKEFVKQNLKYSLLLREFGLISSSGFYRVQDLIDVMLSDDMAAFDEFTRLNMVRSKSHFSLILILNSILNFEFISNGYRKPG